MIIRFKGENPMNRSIFKSASITVEAVLAMPVFLGVIIVFLSFYKVIKLQQTLEAAAYQAAHEAAVYGMVTEKETNNVVSSLYFKERVLSLVKDEITDDFIKGGVYGIDFEGSDIFDENEYVVIKMSYQFEFPLTGRIYDGIDIVQCIYLKSFTGKHVQKKDDLQSQETDEKKVYICSNSEVYHLYRDCPYIKVDLKTVSGKTLEALRNASGGRYKPCESCKPVYNAESYYYITEYGDRYHQSAACKSVKRTVQAISIDEVREKRLCSKCAAKAD